MKLGILTWYHYRNYGTALQAAALSTALRKLGHQPEMIDYHSPGYFTTLPEYSLSRLARKLSYKLRRKKPVRNPGLFGEEKDQKFEAFLHRHIQFTPRCYTLSDLERLNASFDAFVCGSDQIWSPLVFHPRYFLDFVREPQRKIAYAPSIGTEEIRDRFVRSEMAKLLANIGSLSVREESGRRIIRELTGRDAAVVVDPTQLLTQTDWINTFGLQQAADAKPYLLVYFLGNQDEYWTAAKNTAETLGLEFRIIPVFQSDLDRPGCIRDAVGPQEFLQLFLNAAYVCTDSFHGLSFATLFQKPFTTFLRFSRKDPRNQNARVLHFLEKLALADRLWQGGNTLEIAQKQPDFEATARRLGAMRESSMAYLKDALSHVSQPEIKKHVTEQNALCCGCGACVETCPVKAIGVEMNDSGFRTARVNESLCIRCGKCLSVCPFCTETRSVPAESAALYSFRASDEKLLQSSSSGGAAFILAQALLRDGYRIAGCRFNRQSQCAEHILISSEEELSTFQGSKYIQSDFAPALAQIKACSGPVAVFGTPCQIAGARRLLAERDNVLYVDLVCHGVPSYHLFRQYRQHIKRAAGVDPDTMLVHFRSKPKGWRDFCLHAEDDAHSYSCDKEADPFFRMFEVGNCYNESCYECRWRQDSEADLRLADYWGPKFEHDTGGVSMVVCFTSAGTAAAERLRASGTLESQPISDYLQYQQSANHPKPVFYDSLIEALKNPRKKLDYLVSRYVTPFESKHLSRAEHFRYLLTVMRRK